MALPATVISGSDYQTIANAYGRLKYKLDQASTYLYTAVNTIVLVDTLEPTLDLVFDFYSTYSVNTSTIGAVGPYLKAVQTLNAHCIARGGFTDINGYLAEAAITVPQKWADLSAAAGYTISGTYINGGFVY